MENDSPSKTPSILHRRTVDEPALGRQDRIVDGAEPVSYPRTFKSRKAASGFLIGVLIQLAGLYSHFDLVGVAMGAIVFVGGYLKARTKPDQMQVAAVGIGMMATEAVAVVLVILRIL